MDADDGGKRLADSMEKIARACGQADLRFHRDQPATGKDWNDMLRSRRRSLPSEPIQSRLQSHDRPQAAQPKSRVPEESVGLAFPGPRRDLLRLSYQLSFAFKVAKQRRERHAKCRRHLCNVLETQITFAALDGSHERPVNAAFIGKRLLGKALLRPEFPDPSPESLQEQI
jgi:hypothetical protein